MSEPKPKITLADYKRLHAQAKKLEKRLQQCEEALRDARGYVKASDATKTPPKKRQDNSMWLVLVPVLAVAGILITFVAIDVPADPSPSTYNERLTLEGRNRRANVRHRGVIVFAELGWQSRLPKVPVPDFSIATITTLKDNAAKVQYGLVGEVDDVPYKMIIDFYGIENPRNSIVIEYDGDLY